MLYSKLLSATAVALQLRQTTLAFAIPHFVDLMIRSKDPDDHKNLSLPYDKDDAPEIYDVLGLIEDISDETLDQGDQAVKD